MGAPCCFQNVGIKRGSYYPKVNDLNLSAERTATSAGHTATRSCCDLCLLVTQQTNRTWHGPTAHPQYLGISSSLPFRPLFFVFSTTSPPMLPHMSSSQLRAHAQAATIACCMPRLGRLRQCHRCNRKPGRQSLSPMVLPLRQLHAPSLQATTSTSTTVTGKANAAIDGDVVENHGTRYCDR